MTMADSQLSARQRRHVHMASSIFGEDGPCDKSLYVAGRQQEVYEQLRGKLRENNTQPPDLSMPSAGDVRCTQNAGHGQVWSIGAAEPAVSTAPPTEDATVRTPRVSRTCQDYVVYDGEAKPVVKRLSGDAAAIPKEFWATSVNLQWHDTRNESCRGRGPEVPGRSADEMRRYQMSSEVFGKERMTNTSSTGRPRDLVAETQDCLVLDSSFGNRSGGQQQPATARDRYQQNLSKSALNTIPASEPPARTSGGYPGNEDPATTARRRTEKNFSDLFGSQMPERKDIRGNREEALGARTCCFFDARSEIAARNKGHWKHEDVSAAGRKQAERSSNLFDRQSPAKPDVDQSVAEVSKVERACWESKDGMALASEIARRRRQKDHMKDFEGDLGATHQTRWQRGMTSEGVAGAFGNVRSAGHGAQSPRLAGGVSPIPSIPNDRTAKDTKLASLQSSIFF